MDLLITFRIANPLIEEKRYPKVAEKSQAWIECLRYAEIIDLSIEYSTKKLAAKISCFSYCDFIAFHRN